MNNLIDTAVFATHSPGLGQMAMLPVVPNRDAPMIHSWVVEERAKFWGMGDHTVAEVQEVYEFLDGLDSHHAYLVFLNGEPSALFQTYEPMADPIGECYDVRPGDYGVHVMMAPPDTTRHGFTAAMLDMLADFAFRDPAHQRVVIEPDARNDKAIARFAAYGFAVGQLTELPHKTARLAFLTRETYEVNREGHSVERSS